VRSLNGARLSICHFSGHFIGLISSDPPFVDTT
jgi:hypothetical protein